MSFDLIIKNGTVILENEARVIDIAVQGGKIAAIGENLGEAKNVLDATGLIVSPGMVDAHTHISEPGRTHSGKAMKPVRARRRKAVLPR